MGRPRKPTKVLELTGRFKHDPQRKRERENEPDDDRSLGDPPECLDESQRARWVEMAMEGQAWLRWSHRTVLEMAARLKDKIRKEGVAAKGSDFAVLKSYLAEIGITPASQSKVQTPGAGKKKAANPFDAVSA